MDNDIILEGSISVKAAIQARAREVRCVWLDGKKYDRNKSEIDSLAREAGIEVQKKKREEINGKAYGQTHGGIIAFAGKRRFLEPDHLLLESDNPFIVMLDGIEDPFNMGSSIRSLYAAGADGIVLTPRDWGPGEAALIKASAGTSELMPAAQMGSAEAAAAFFRENGCAVACTSDREKSQSLYETNLDGPLFLIIGGEKRGITRSFLKEGDMLLHVPYGREWENALDTSSAVAVIAFEIRRQRAKG